MELKRTKSLSPEEFEKGEIIYMCDKMEIKEVFDDENIEIIQLETIDENFIF